eukprot:4623681-Pleurochrysis_carterae.AAC.4
MAEEVVQLKAKNQQLRDEGALGAPGHHGTGQGVLPPQRLHPGCRARHCQGHHDRARLEPPGTGPLPNLRAFLPHQTANPLPQSAAQGRLRQDDSRRKGVIALRPGQDTRQKGLRVSDNHLNVDNDPRGSVDPTGLRLRH